MGNSKSSGSSPRSAMGPASSLPSNTQEYVAGSASRGYSVFRRSDGSFIAQIRGGKTVEVVKARNGYRVKGVEGRGGKLGEYAKNEVAKREGVSARAAGRYIAGGDGENLTPRQRASRTRPAANNRRQRPQ